MPRIRYALAPRGLYLNNIDTLAPDGTLLRARNAASLAGTGYLRSSPPVVTIASGTGGTNPLVLRAMTRFNGRTILRGETAGPTQRFRRESASGSNIWADLTLPTTPTVTLRSSTSPTLFCTAAPTPEKDEFLFILDTPNSITAGTPGTSDNALLKLNDAGTLSHWGILPVTAAAFGAAGNVTAIKNNQSTKYIINGGASDPMDDAAAIGTVALGATSPGALTNWVLSSGDEDALTDDSRLAVSGTVAPQTPPSTKSLRLRAEKDAVVEATRVFAASVDLTTFGAVASSEADFIQFWVRVRRAKHIQSLEVQFDTTDGTFTNNVYSREINFQLVRGRKRRKLVALGDLVPDRKQKEFLAKQSSGVLDLTHSEDLGKQRVPIAKNTWARVTLPKNTFNGDGTPSWAAVRAVRFVLHSNKEGRAVVFLDELQLVGGAGLHGDYEYTITLSNEAGTPASAGSRSNPPIDDDKGTVTNLRNSIVTVKVSDVERQSVRLTFVAGLTFDPQVTRLEIWRTVGNGQAFFRAGYITVTVAGTIAAGTTFDDSAADYYGLNSSATPAVVGNNTSFAVLDPTEELPIDNTSPNDPSFVFQDMADRPHLGRMWWGRNVAATTETNLPVQGIGNQGLIYYSPPGRLEAVQGFVPVTSGVTDPVQKLIVWNDRLFVFTTANLYEILGNEEPFVAHKIEGATGTRFPYTVQPTPIGIIWLNDEGVYKFNGQYAENVTDAALMPVFRHRITTGEISPVTVVTTCRAIAGRHTYYLGPDFLNFTMIYDYESGTWRYGDLLANSTANAGGAYYDGTTGQVLADSTTGGADITEIEPRTYPTSGTHQFFTVEPLPWFRAGPGKQGILRKVWIDVTRGANGATTGVAGIVFTDDTQTALTSFTITSTDVHHVQEFNLNLPGERFGIRLTINNVRDVRINAIEMDIYVPDATDEAPG